MKEYIVYIHISPSNKRYIGITKREAKKRWGYKGNRYKNNEHFYSAINKYGWDNFQHIIIAKGLTKEEAEWLEIELIKVWDTTNRDKGYNIVEGGNAFDGLKGELNPMYGLKGELSPLYGIERSKETREKMSKVKKGELNPMYGKGYLISGEKHPMYGRKGELCPNYGLKRSEETKEKISKSRKGKYKGKNNSCSKPTICLTTKRIFFSATEGAEYYGIKNKGDVSSCCRGKRKSCGKLENGTKLVWRYLVWKHNKKYRIMK